MWVVAAARQAAAASRLLELCEASRDEARGGVNGGWADATDGCWDGWAGAESEVEGGLWAGSGDGE